MSKKTSAVLAFTAGFIDTATFIAISGLFSAHVTGNFIVFAGALARGLREVDFLKLAVFPVFILAVGLGTVLYEHWRERPFPGAGHRLLSTKLILLITALGLVLFSHGLRVSQEVTALDATAALVLTFAMGLQNAFHKLHSPTTPATTMMTGNVSTLTVKLTKRLVLKSNVKSAVDIASVFVVTGFFLIGCVVSGFMTSWIGLGSIALPAAILAVLLYSGTDAAKN